MMDITIVDRGQGLSQTDFERLMKTKGGLLSFNGFLSTSKIRCVSFAYTQRTFVASGLINPMFVMKIYPSIFSTPFVNAHDVSYYREGDEILLSFNSVFRIVQIKQINGNNSIWQIELTLTSTMIHSCML